MKLTAIPQYRRNARRFEQILRILVKYGLADWLKPSLPDFLKKNLESAGGEDLTAVSRPEAIRLALTELGTTFIKMGQMLSTRADLIGPEIADELTRLQSDTPPDPPDTVSATIEDELGASPSDIFARFDDVPIASASIAQAHLAELTDGTPVVVKVQHEGIEHKVVNDLEILIALADFAEKRSTELSLYQPVALLGEFRRRLLAELDFQQEERSLLRFQSNFAGDETVRIPEVFPEHTAKRVLTMERLEGTSIARSEALAGEGADLREIARRGATAYLEMIFRDRVYHADPHPGNILVLPGNVVGLLDFGMVGQLDNRTNEIFEELIQGILLKDGELLTDCVLMLGHAPPDIDREKLQADIETFMATNLTDSIKDMNTSRMFVGLTEIVRRHRIVQNPNVSLLIKVLVMLEGSSRLLDSDFNLSELLEPYYEKMIQRKLAPKNVFRRVQRAYRDWDRLFHSLPRDLADVLQRFRKGTLDVHLEHRHLDTVVNRIAYGVVTAAVFLGSAMILSQAIPPTVKGASIPGIAGIVFSLWLVRRLFRAIRKSGGL